jgi:hypothetical protein
MTIMTEDMPCLDEVPQLKSGRSEGTAVLLALIPVAVFIALLVLIAMSANAASATGGCGGG